MALKCFNCVNREEVPGNCHIRCKKPDPDMTGNEHGIRKGWFSYPYLFDPVWATKECRNYERDLNNVSEKDGRS